MRISKFLSKDLILFLLIVVFAFVLRVYALDKIPASINPDEASLGYTSYSLLHTGADEHGVFLPLSLESFGDWKLPGYSYLGILPVAFFGLNVVSVRLVSAIAGVIGVALAYWICLKLFRRKSIAFVAALFFAISPWSIYFSRAAYEVNLATTFFLAGFLLFLQYLEENNKSRLVILSSIFFAITVFTYHSYIIFTPLFVLGLGYLSRNIIKLNKGFVVALFILTASIAVSFYASIFTSSNKTSTLLVFNDSNVTYNRADKIKGDGSGNKMIEKIIYNKVAGGLYQFGQNYLNTFAPSFLFDKGGEKLVDNLGYFGNIYLIDILFILFGLAGLFLQKEKSLKFLILWLILAPIPAALTKSPQSSTRLFLLMPVLVLICAYGAWQMANLLKRKTVLNYALKLFLLVLFIYNVLLFMDGYFVHLNTQRARFWKYGYEQVAELSQKFSNYKIVMRGPENFPYIYFLFFNRYNPKEFRSEVKYYPPTSEGFLYVKSFGRFSFPQSIDSRMEHKTIYIDDNYFKYKDKIFLPSGEPILAYYVNN